MGLWYFTRLNPVPPGKTQAPNITCEVFGRRDRFHMIRVDAHWITAKVIEFIALWYGAFMKFVEPAVCQFMLAGLRLFIPDVDLRPFRVLNRALPYPASGFTVNNVHLAGKNPMTMARKETGRMSLCQALCAISSFGYGSGLSTTAQAQALFVGRVRPVKPTNNVPIFATLKLDATLSAYFTSFWGMTPGRDIGINIKRIAGQNALAFFTFTTVFNHSLCGHKRFS